MSRIALDAISLILFKGSFVGLRLSVLLILAKNCTPIVFADYALAFTVVEMARYISDWGAEIYFTRKFSIAGEHRTAIQSAIFLRGISSIVGLCCTTVTIFFLITEIDFWSKILISLIVVSGLWANISIAYLNAQKIAYKFSWVPVLVLLIWVPIFVGHKEISNDFLLTTLLLSEFFVAASAAMASYKNGRISLSSPHGFKAMELIKEMTPIALASIISMGYSKVDLFIMKAYSATEAISSYQLVGRAYEPILFIFSAASSVLYARQSELVSSASFNIENWVKWINKWTWSVLGISLLIGILTSIFFLKFALLFYPEYTDAHLYSVMCFFLFASRCVNIYLSSMLQAAGLYSHVLRCNTRNLITFPIFIIAISSAISPKYAPAGVLLGEIVNTVMLRLGFDILFRSNA